MLVDHATLNKSPGPRIMRRGKDLLRFPHFHDPPSYKDHLVCDAGLKNIVVTIITVIEVFRLDPDQPFH